MSRGTNRSRHNSPSDDDPLPVASLRLLAPPLRLVSAAMWKVMQQRDVMHYGKLEEFVTSVSETVPDLLSYRHQAKLCVGLRARLILEQVRVDQSSDTRLIRSLLERLRAPALPESKSMKVDKKVEMAVKNFHTLVQILLDHPAKREQFFKEEFVEQYGPQYDSALEKLLWEFLTRLDQLLPVPDLAQTVSWLTAAPAVLEECARSASQPQLLRTLLQHEKCLGHLHSAASIPATTGDSILSSLTLPPSGIVRNSNQSASTPTSNVMQSPTSSPQMSNRRLIVSVSRIAPVIGTISTADVQDNKEGVTGVSDYTRVRTKSCQKSEILEKVPNEERYVGDVLITVLNQTTTSSEDEEVSHIGPVRPSSGKTGARDNEGVRGSDKTLDLKRKREDSRTTSERNSEGTKPQTDENLHAKHSSCMKRQLRVVLPRLHINDPTQRVQLRTTTSEELATVSPRQPANENLSAVRTANALNRKRKLCFLVTPEKNLPDSTEKQAYAGSPCIPTLMPLWVANSDAVSPVPESTDEVIVDSEDEATEKVKGRLFTTQYCKTKNDTYIPTLHEFWTPAFYRRDLLSPGNGCR